ncbi:MAG: glycosyltransferase [Terriglobales bacterium]
MHAKAGRDGRLGADGHAAAVAAGGMRAGQCSRRAVWVVDALQLGGAERLALRFHTAAARGWALELVALQPPRAGAARALWGTALAAVHSPVRELAMRRLTDLGEWRRLARLLAPRPGERTLVHSHLHYATVWAGWAARRHRLPHVVTVHVGRATEAPGRECGWRARALGRLEQGARRRAARVVYVNELQRDGWDRQARRERAVVIPNGVELSTEPREPARRWLLERLGAPAEATVVTTVAVVRRQKGWQSWIEAAERVTAARPGVWFVWVGAGPDFDRLRQQVAASGARTRIVLAGARADVGRWLAASDMFLFPSEAEAQPTAVLEAMAASLAVVATDLDASRALLGGAGQLTAPGDAAAMAGAVLAWSGPERAAARQAAGEAGRRRAATEYSETGWRERLLDLYEEVGDAWWGKRTGDGGAGSREGCTAADPHGGDVRPRGAAAL